MNTDSERLVPVILSGGSGSRLWPVSRALYPKQFLKLNGERDSLLQESLARISAVANRAAPIMVCNEEHRFLVAEQLRERNITADRIILEREGRNTAPALTLAALRALEVEEDPVLLVMPADHVIADVSVFEQAVASGVELARDGYLITFGITPARAHTGYGYIRSGEPLRQGYRVASFVEKPDRATAEGYLAEGGYYWNSGIFLFNARRYLSEMEVHAADILRSVEKAWATRRDDMDFLRVDAELFARCRSESIDYALMERTRHAAMVPLDARWSDIGAWDALYDARADRSDAQGNVSEGDVFLHDTHDSLVISESRLVAAVGLSNVVAVETEDAILLADKSRAQDVRHVVDYLKRSARPEFKSHQRVYRPWGYYRTMFIHEGFQVKEIMVHPGAALSLQMHHHRAEHWVVVRGTARVTQGERNPDHEGEGLRSFLLAEDESTYIPLGHVHRLENPGMVPLKLIEVQTGSYLGEDDIVRFEDIYGRIAPAKDSHSSA